MDFTRNDLDSHCYLLRGRLDGRIADTLEAEIRERATWVQETIRSFGRSVAQPRLTAWFGRGYSASSRYREASHAAPWPPHLDLVRAALSDALVTPFNAALANRYRDGHDSVDWHADDEPNLGPAPVIASVSLGVTRDFDLRPRDGGEIVRLALRHGDVLVMAGETQRRWRHRARKQPSVAGERLNLTLRHYFD